MPGRLLLICRAATRDDRIGRFGAAAPPDAVSLAAAAALAETLGPVERAWCDPAPAARATAAALAVAAAPEEALREVDYGRWAGMTVKQVTAAEPEAFARWLAEDAAAPHGGESFADLAGRVGGWLQSRLADEGPSVAVAGAAVLRAAVAAGLGCPAAFRRIELDPLARVELRSDGRRWTLRLVSGLGV